MTPSLTPEEVREIEDKLAEVRLEHNDLDQIIDRLSRDSTVEELQLKRLKKRRLYLKDQIASLENELIPDILA